MSAYCFHYRFEADLRFNSGDDPVYTCGNCNTIVARASKAALKAERDTRAERDRLATEVKTLRARLAAVEALATRVDVMRSMASGTDIRAALAGESPVTDPDCCCACAAIDPPDFPRMIVCSTCGNKRCPKATDHHNVCTGSNEPGQERSVYT